MSLAHAVAAVIDVTRAARSLRSRGFRRAAGPLWRDGAFERVDFPVSLPPSVFLRHRWLGRTRFLPWSTCLSRSLALGRHALALGLAPALCIGTTLDDSGFGAHAWIRVGDQDFGRSGHQPMDAPVGISNSP